MYLMMISVLEMFNKVKLYALLVLALAITVGGVASYVIHNLHKTTPIAISSTSPPAVIYTPQPLVTVNTNPLAPIHQEIAKQDVTQQPSTVIVKGNKQPVTIIVPPSSLKGDSNDVVVPSTNNEIATSSILVPPGGESITLPQQSWTVHLERTYSPFKLQVDGPDPSIGIGYEAITVSLDHPLGINLNLGNLSAGPYLVKFMVNNNFYGGLEISKSLGRVNLDLGYGVKIGSSEFS